MKFSERYDWSRVRRRSRGRKEIAASSLPPSVLSRPRAEKGFTLIELVITLAVLTVLTLGVIPLIKTSVKRQREQELREALREMRNAIEDFHRDAMGGPCASAAGPGGAPGLVPGGQVQPGGIQPGGVPGAIPGGGQSALDPRSRVTISDCTIFNVDNLDRYPPKLETMVEGVSVMPRGGPPIPTNPLQGNATDNKLLALKKKVYLRRVPVDPMTGKAEWDLRSNYDPADANSWGGENVFDVRSKSKATALNGEKYSEW